MRRKLDRKMSMRSMALACCLAMAAPLLSGSSCYDDFVVVHDATELLAALAVPGNKGILLEPGLTYEVSETIVIDEPGKAIAIHGGNGARTALKLTNPSDPDDPSPIIRVKQAAGFQLHKVRLVANGVVQQGGSYVDHRALIFEPDGGPVTSTNFSFQDSIVVDGVVEIGLPGTYQLEQVVFHPRGQTLAPLVVNHAGADVSVMSGNISNPEIFPLAPELSAGTYSHIRVADGRLRIYSTLLGGALGCGDIRLEKASALGPHAVVGIRTEGANNEFSPCSTPVLVSVPESDEAVDVLVKGNFAAWSQFEGHTEGHLVDYNAEGTLWLIGNNGYHNSTTLVQGEASNATIVAIGNVVGGENVEETTGSPTLIAKDNLWATVVGGQPKVLPLDPATPALQDLPAIPALPRVATPAPGPRYQLTPSTAEAMGMVVAPPPAGGGGDDTAALQAALDVTCAPGQLRAGAQLFIPEGEYQISDALQVNTVDRTCIHSAGGWIAGAGSDKTKITRTTEGPVFESDGVFFMTVQGLTFEAQPASASTPFAVVRLDYQKDPEAWASYPVNGRTGQATGKISLWDLHLRGGNDGLGLGLDYVDQTDAILCIECLFEDYETGMAVRHPNAVDNIAWSSTFLGQPGSVGVQQRQYSSGNAGTFDVYGSTFVGNDVDVDTVESAVSFVVEDVETDSSQPIRMDSLSQNLPQTLVVDQALFSGAVPPHFELTKTGTITIAHSESTAPGPATVGMTAQQGSAVIRLYGVDLALSADPGDLSDISRLEARDDLVLHNVQWIYGLNAWLYADVESRDGAGAVTVTVNGTPNPPPPEQPLAPCTGSCSSPNSYKGFVDAPQVTESVEFFSDVGGYAKTTSEVP